MKNDSPKIDFRKTILFWFAASMLALLAVISVASYVYINNELAGDLDDQANHVQMVFQQALNKDAETISALIDRIAEDNRLIQAYVEKKREQLLDTSRNLFEENRQKYRVTHFYFHDTDGINYLRSHNPPRYGDRIKRFTLHEAQQKQKQSWGIELGPLGTFTLRVVRPWIVDGQLIGYIELGEEIEHIAPAIKNTSGLDFIFVIDKQYLDKDQWLQASLAGIDAQHNRPKTRGGGD